MSKKLIKFVLTTFGLAILVACITTETDGIGRFAMIFSGVFFTYLGFFVKEK